MWARTTLREVLNASISMCRGNGHDSTEFNTIVLPKFAGSSCWSFTHSLSLPPSCSSGSSHLALLSTVQDKVTVCATNDSYQVTRERMTQAAEDTRERGTKVIKPGGRYRGRKSPGTRPGAIPGWVSSTSAARHASQSTLAFFLSGNKLDYHWSLCDLL